jgi:hypothetical protein
MICLLSLGLSIQDPTSRPSTATSPGPSSRPALPPIEAAAIDRRDLIQRFTPPSPLAGFWELRLVVGPEPALAGLFRGYLVIGDRHLSLHIIGPTHEQRVPFLQSGFRRYRIDGDRLVMTALMGISNKENGDVVIENTATEEVRTFERVGAVLRIRKASAEYMDFVRIE